MFSQKKYMEIDWNILILSFIVYQTKGTFINYVNKQGEGGW